MATSSPSAPASSRSAAQVLDAYFLETRAKLLEIAANLDRVDRAPPHPPSTPPHGRDAHATAVDPRLTFIQEALKILQSPAPNRAELIQRLYSIQP